MSPLTQDPRSHGLWARSAPPAPETPSLAGEAQVEALVIGAGYTGLSAALHLAEGGMRTLVLEAEEPGFGGAGRNVGLVNAGMWVMPEAVLESFGPERGEALLDLLGAGPERVFRLIARHGISCEAVHAGTLHCGVGRKGMAELQERERQWKARGADVELLGREAAAGLVGSGIYEGALLDRRAGTIQPLAYARGLAGAALAAGARICGGSPALEARHDGEAWIVRTPGGSARAPRLILATDAYGRDLWPEAAGQQTRLPYFNFATAPLPEALRAQILPQRQGAWDTKEVLTSFRMDAAGRLVVGSVGALQGIGARIHRDWARRAMAALHPDLAEIPFEAEWFGVIGMTDDSLPRLHRLGPQALAICGYNGRGIAPGTVFGAALAAHLLGDLPLEGIPLPEKPLAQAPCRALREGWYELGAQMLHAVEKRL
ncbi:FAD-binding oxidoreductase [Neomegalonema sp.]|uniref:NAD(P)/FAD-dependent oxidoreductase n=1 Tax=Neomegalonema sp. TaxID=2039713 RepID=UPI00260FA73F|nr:FAD-binding oxidoreductase [Neomegalonema sp.]MDD2869944.1 FAD-binding oxidoreductase [Neomegalonema sp.]